MSAENQELDLKIRSAPIKLYCNGFVTATTVSDVLVLVVQNGQPSASINMSFTTAKSLAAKLGSLISDLERDTGHEIMTTEYVEEKRHQN